MTTEVRRWAGHPEETSPPASVGRWRRAPGLVLLGEARDVGVSEPRHLVRRGDGQVLQVSELVALVLRELSQTRTPEAVADAVTHRIGRRLGVEGLEHLLSRRLRPLGLVVDSGAAPGPHAVPRADPLLSLRLRGTLLPAAAVARVSRVLAPLFLPPVVLAALAALVVLDVALLLRGNPLAALDQVLATPALVLALVAVLTAGAVVHELGHAAACRYSGGRPGRVGVGIYLVFPAFFTDVTDSYRLSRSGRIRTDLGGLYFNVLVVVALAAVYLQTGHGLALLAVLLTHLQMLQQLVPIIRLDGYWVLSDVAGVPDLFARLGPVLRSLPPWRPTHPLVAELRPASRRVVVAWVVVVVPLLVAATGWLVASTPAMLARTWAAAAIHADRLVTALATADVVGVAVALLSLALLALPVVGLALVLHRLSSPLLRRTRSQVRNLVRPPVPRHAREDPMPNSPQENAFPSQWERLLTAAAPTEPPQDRSPAPPPQAEDDTAARVPGDDDAEDRLTAADFTDEAVLPRHRQPPSRGWRRQLFTATGGRVNAGPGPAELAEQALRARVNAPISGSRRVVVMSRKGGVGKTTVTFALGSTFAMLRGDRVVAVDANPDAGNLAYRVGSHPGRTLTDLLADADRIDRYAVLREYLTQAPDSGLEVLASDDDPRITLALDRQAYGRVIELLDHYYNLILLDTGTGILDSANQGLLHDADQLVLVLRPALDGARAAAATLDWLDEHGFGELVTRAVVAVNASRGDGESLLPPLEDHFRARCSAVVRIPWDRRLEAGARTSLTELAGRTRAAFTELAAAVADSVSRTGDP